ncbi:MAG: hypothetical protein IPL58_11725 [Betaproteobacteria bacterium]|uniref:Uncharacterized protein n=1 Tax=Candidatus Proximibacter danicus TaxID=2954365 RepID=A0A9D7K372_9PROT|nr:hypothetical protein [Candidatus Proximibacter danicus]
MKFVIHAPNVHQGGGRTLLLALLEELRTLDADCVAVLDERLKLSAEFSSEIAVLRVKPTVIGRFFAE